MRDHEMQGSEIMSDQAAEQTPAASPAASPTAPQVAAPQVAAAQVAAAQPSLTVEHANVLGVQRELSFENGKWRYGLVVITDLSLDPASAAHSSADIDLMVRAVVAAARAAGAGYDVMTIRNA